MSSLDLSSLPQLDPATVRVLWVNDWYDGLLEAVVEHAGVRGLLCLHDPEAIATAQPWRWVLYRLTPAQSADEARWHRLFLEHVGAHWDCTGDDPPLPSGQPARFYDAFGARAPRGPLEPVGWLDLPPNVVAPGL